MQNSSLSTDVQITVGPTEISHTELPMDRQKNVLTKGSTITIPVELKGGCAMLFVWDSGRLRWKGIVPIGNEQPLVVDPDTPKVTYGIINIPENSGSVSREYFGTTETVKSKNTLLIAILAILGVIGLGVLIWYLVRRSNSLKF